jgi:hypothetical protein
VITIFAHSRSHLHHLIYPVMYLFKTVGDVNVFVMNTFIHAEPRRVQTPSSRGRSLSASPRLLYTAEPKQTKLKEEDYKVYIRGLPYTSSREWLYEFMVHYGHVKSIDIMTKYNSRVFAYVKFHQPPDPAIFGTKLIRGYRVQVERYKIQDSWRSHYRERDL